MKIFVDTNVWLSGRFRPGLCAELLEALVGLDATILLDERVLGEFKRIARDKLKVNDVDLARAELFFRDYTVVVPAADDAAEGIPDPDDAWIIAAALSAGADLFVTGDKELLALGVVGGMPVIDPRTAYMRLRWLG
ncbi:putative toxin-antitoxin system toxin component, PIN family [Methylococcus sp. Mc7]|uniref:putative toxin-antitoxin system toxin component, PIN family n=1 Tax=Methylococcus sp. Mc7 TaxID=2860258 RepID=UPI001C5311C5|nr:putative toxin-antitoxin system toxin component, PIN family [Methylococcus sp. Mc7]QXP83817.1 putative toxin-antitoxin system toxin component, PIN family [Methylococcus sp. Mc7]